MKRVVRKMTIVIIDNYYKCTLLPSNTIIMINIKKIKIKFKFKFLLEAALPIATQRDL